MRIKFELFTKMVFCYSFIVNCAKPDHVFNMHEIGTYMRSGFLLNGCCFDDKQAPFIYKYQLSQKALSTLNMYKIVIRLKSQILRKEGCSLVADKHTHNHFFFGSSSKPLEHRQTCSPPELPAWSKVTTTFFLCVDQF